MIIIVDFTLFKHNPINIYKHLWINYYIGIKLWIQQKVLESKMIQKKIPTTFLPLTRCFTMNNTYLKVKLQQSHKKFHESFQKALHRDTISAAFPITNEYFFFFSGECNEYEQQTLHLSFLLFFRILALCCTTQFQSFTDARTRLR